jgi:hypothetical protein
VAVLLDGVSRVGECRENFAIPAGLSPGLYFLALESKGQQVTQKVILE